MVTGSFFDGLCVGLAIGAAGLSIVTAAALHAFREHL